MTFVTTSAGDLGPLARLDVNVILEWTRAGVAVKDVDQACREGIDPMDLVDVPLPDMVSYGRYLVAAASRGVSAKDFFALVHVPGWTLRHLDWVALGYSPGDLAALSDVPGALAALSTPVSVPNRAFEVTPPASREERHLVLVLTGVLGVPHEAAVAFASLVPASSVETMSRLLLDGMSCPDALAAAVALTRPRQAPVLPARGDPSVRLPRSSPGSPADAVRSA